MDLSCFMSFAFHLTISNIIITNLYPYIFLYAQLKKCKKKIEDLKYGKLFHAPVFH